MQKFGMFRGMHDTHMRMEVLKCSKRIHFLALSQDWDTFVRFEAGNDMMMLKEGISLHEFVLAMNHQLHL